MEFFDHPQLPHVDLLNIERLSEEGRLSLDMLSNSR